MCGIAGGFNFSKNKINLKQDISKVLDFQHNRGPDSRGLWLSDSSNVCFGHNRLSIIDLSDKANQPFVSNDENYVITYNGEIYNYIELKTELIKKNIKFKSSSDTEVILESYKLWGTDSFKKFRGMFAFSIFDKKKNKLILARDPFGIKPLYYSIQKNILYFASLVNSFKFIENFTLEYSNQNLVNYYFWGNLVNTQTPYRNLHLLGGGEYLSIDLDGNVKKYKYADIKEEILNSSILNLSNKQEINDYLKHYIDETVRYHQVADVPVSILLSSGIDSSVIAASSNDNQNYNSITLDFEKDNKSHNESLLAKKTAKLNNLRHEILKLNNDEVEQYIADYLKYMDVPSNDGLNNFIISSKAKSFGSKVIVSGVGSDELFAGYPSFSRIPKINNIFKHLPYNKTLNFLFENSMNFLCKVFKLNSKFSQIYKYGKNISDAFFLQRCLFIPQEIKQILRDTNLKDFIKPQEIINELNDEIIQIKNKRLKITYLELKYYLIPKLLRDADWSTMSNSVELRTPFVDFHFFKKILPFLNSRNFQNKKVLFYAYKSKLPKELLTRKKTGFSVPYNGKNNLNNTLNNKYFTENQKWSLNTINNYLNL